MVLRIHFSPDDLALTTFAEAPDPFWETLLGLHALQAGHSRSALTTWRAEIAPEPTFRSLQALAPSRGYSPDFLTPSEAREGFDAGLDALLRTRAARRQVELARLSRGAPVPPALQRLVTHEATFRDMAAALTRFHRTAIQPLWSRIETDFHRHRTHCGRALLGRGFGELIGSLHPALCWCGSSLEVAGDHVNGDLELAGRGLRIIPSYFCDRRPTVLADPRLPPVLVYPLPARAEHDSSHPIDLGGVLGKTKMLILAATARGSTTTALSTAARISLSSASYHAASLRKAGLIVSERMGSSVRHSLTPLGEDVLRAGQEVH
ncbi:helix-turn-helix domain-containing protein [Amycolatopsis sp. NBC_01488]|uniref:helix-turn-helix domain-containing protein n=1 Tax=Amycolatopsis sp. NBC_01488 TaxID=2903563 RepID=UPI002E2E5BF5|nr:helix-turn-helix domain-containing protein [Amycolatopsis sp. NBC_01488]